MQAVIIPQSGSAPANEEAMKSAGRLARIRICRVRSLFSTVEWLQECGVQVVATALSDRAIPNLPSRFEHSNGYSDGFGGEGVHHKLIKMSDAVVKIPQATDFDSFNVSVAAGIVLYEALRQREK